MIIGPSTCGKTTFSQALYDMELEYKKTQAIEIVNQLIDTPGEYLENKAYFRAFMVTSVEADVIILMQPVDIKMSLYPPQFATMFTGKEIVGLVSKVDIAKNPEAVKKAEESLLLAGAQKVFSISSVTKEGIAEVKRYLLGEE